MASNKRIGICNTHRVSLLHRRETQFEDLHIYFVPPPQWGGLDLSSSNRGCARLGGEVDPPLGVVVEEVAT